MQEVIYRICAYSRKSFPRESMFRVVKTPNHEIRIDSSYKLQGRGAYLSKDKDIIMTAKKRHVLERCLKVLDCQSIYDQMIDLLK
jgi:hypothetical protein